MHELDAERLAVGALAGCATISRSVANSRPSTLIDEDLAVVDRLLARSRRNADRSSSWSFNCSMPSGSRLAWRWSAHAIGADQHQRADRNRAWPAAHRCAESIAPAALRLRLDLVAQDLARSRPSCRRAPRPASPSRCVSGQLGFSQDAPFGRLLDVGCLDPSALRRKLCHCASTEFGSASVAGIELLRDRPALPPYKKRR